MQLNFGPAHPAAHGVLRLVLQLDGEVCKLIVIDFIKVSLFNIAFSVISKIPISITAGIFRVMGKLISVNLRSRLFFYCVMQLDNPI